MILRPFFSYFGAKWSSAHRYPEARHRRIVEPFAGSAGFSLRHHRRDIVLCDRDPAIADLWRWLITASADDVLNLPDVAPGQPVAELGVVGPAATLIGFWLGRGLARPRLTGSTSEWATDPQYADQFWGPHIRQRIAGQLPHIRHWTVLEGDYTITANLGPATWFIDPPYCKTAGDRYRWGASALDFDALGRWCRDRDGQTIVCEAEGADWLPFRPMGGAFTRMSTRDGAGEALWTTGDGQQPTLLGVA